MHRYRSHNCGKVSEDHVGLPVRLSGWVVSVRDIGKLAFLSVRDASGAIQVVAQEAGLVSACRRLRSGSAVTVDGRVASRPRESVRAEDPTGSVEVNLRRVVVLGRASWTGEGAVAPPRVTGVEADAHGALGQHGFTNVGTQAARPLSDFLPRLERVYRMRTAKVADGRADGGVRDSRMLELELGFGTLADLERVIRGLLGALGPLLPAAGPLQALPLDTPMGELLDGSLLLSGLPASGHPVFDGRDLGVTLLAEPSPPPADDRVECLMLIVHGRLVGAGSVLRSERSGALEAIDALDSSDPMTMYELDDAFAAASEVVPGRGWFALDLERLCDVASAEEHTAELDVNLLRHDLSSLLRAADSGRLAPVNTPAAAVHAAARRLEQWDIDASAAMARSRSAASVNAAGRRADGVLTGLDVVLSDFAIEVDVCTALLELDPATRARLARRPPGERFQWLWSVLGTEHVRAALKDGRSYGTIRRAVELRVITDLQQLVYLDVPGLEDLSLVLDGQASPTTDPSSAIVRVLRQALAVSPASFTGLLAALAGATRSDDRPWMRPADIRPMVEAARNWLCSPGLLDAGVHAAQSKASLDALLEAVRVVSPQVLTNAPVDRSELVESFASAVRARVPELAPKLVGGDVAFAIIQHVFRPVSLTFAQAERALSQLPDHCEDVSEAGLATGGRHWSPVRGCYEFGDPPTGRNALTMYLSKNAASFLAKATAGICTARDVELYGRRDHHHLNVVETLSGIVIGNVQLHVLSRDDKRILLIRAVNASSSYLTTAKTRAFVEAAIVACLEIAATSEVDELHIGEGLSFWHLNSSRPEIRAVLEPLYADLPCLILDPSFFLFRFGGVDLKLTKSYRLWERGRGRSTTFRLREFLEVVA